MKVARGRSGQEIVMVEWSEEQAGLFRLLEGNWEKGWKITGTRVSIDEWLPPVDPPVIWGTGLNYRKHLEEMGHAMPRFPVFFMKSKTALCRSGDAIEIPSGVYKSHKVDYEGELGVIIGRKAKNVSKENAMHHVAGYVCANDVSARDWQIENGGSQWVRGKSFDTFCPISSYVVTSDEIEDVHQLAIETRVNGVRRQIGNTSEFLFELPALIEFLSANLTLLPGTLILTGTPHGVGMGMSPPSFLQSGDVVEIEIEKIGLLRNEVK